MLLNGKPVAEAMKLNQTQRVAAGGFAPKLVVIQAGDDLASTTYINLKQRYGTDIGVVVEHRQCEVGTTALKQVIAEVNIDPSAHGLIIQLPLPDRSITSEVVDAIKPQKDVDGLGQNSSFESATAMAVIKLMEYYKIDFDHAEIALIGRGRLVGRPLGRILGRLGATVTVADTSTTDLAAITRKATIIISATGIAGLITPGMISDHSVVIDVGTSEDQGSIVGDVSSALLSNHTLKITPEKGGVGPVTVSMLFEQLLQAAGI